MSSKKLHFRTRFFVWVSFFLLILLFIFLYFKYISGYLSVSKPVSAQILVVEGWIPNYAMIVGKKEFESHNYKLLITSGRPYRKGASFTEFATEADWAATEFAMLGMDPTQIVAVSAAFTKRDRTYASALAVKNYLSKLDYPVKSINLITLGCHSRRSRLLFRMALGKSIKVGIIAVEDKGYDPPRWWKYSNGVRAIIDETIALTYAALFFRPEESDAYSESIIQNHMMEVLHYRSELNNTYKNPAQTPLNEDQLKVFNGLIWFPINIDYSVKGIYIPSVARDTMIFKTSTDRMPLYIKTGKIRFSLFGNVYELSTFQNAEHANDNAYNHILFCPFTDLTTGNTTYGGGRYLDLEVPASDSLEIDFNKSYHPYCAYNHKWSCVIPPPENNIPIEIFAGIRL